MITLDSINYANASIQIIDAAGDALAIANDGSIAVTDNGASLTVDASDLDIRDLAFATDSVDVSGSTVELGATTLAALESITVVATDLDIRNLVFATDKVDVSGSVIETVEGGYDTWTVTALSATTTEGSITALANRLRVEIQNLGTADVYIRQSTGVDDTNGLKIPKGSSYEQALDAGAPIFYVTGSGTSDLRVAQYAA